MARPPKPSLDLSNIVATTDGKWRVDVVRTLPNGQRFRRTTKRADQAEAIKFRDEAFAEFEKLKAGEQVIVANGYTVQEWCDHCLTAIMPSQANRRSKPYEAKTLEDYKGILSNHVYPRIGTVRLAALNTEHLDSLMAVLPSPSIKANVKKTLSRVLTLAEDRGKRPRGSNPCKAIMLPVARRQRTAGKTIKHETVDPQDRRKRIVTETAVPDGLIIESVRVLTFDEEAALLSYVRNHPYHSDYLTLLMLGLRLGLRIGEALGLDWSAVDFEANTVRIDQQMQREKGRGNLVKGPKSEAGYRTIPMPKSLSEYLRGVKLLASSPHVVCNSHGNRRDADRASARIKELMIGAGLGDKVDGRRYLPRPTFHDMRRTCLTRLATGHVAEGVVVAPVPPTVLIKISGHEDVQTLLSFYTSADDSMVTAAMASMP